MQSVVETLLVLHEAGHCRVEKKYLFEERLYWQAGKSVSNRAAVTLPVCEMAAAIIAVPGFPLSLFEASVDPRLHIGSPE